MIRWFLTLSVCFLVTPATATSTNTGTFDVYLAGLKAGVLGFSGVENDTQYSTSAKIRSSGLVSLVSEVTYDARVTGTVNGSGYVPSRYEETANTGRRISSAVMEYVRGTPQVKAYDPPQKARPNDLDPATQSGTVDPMTAIYALLRDVEEDAACTVDVFVFDGRRRSQVDSMSLERDGRRLICEGEYRWIAGFKPEDLERRSVYPFRITYEPNGDGLLTVSRIVFRTLYGNATFVRR